MDDIRLTFNFDSNDLVSSINVINQIGESEMSFSACDLRNRIESLKWQINDIYNFEIDKLLIFQKQSSGTDLEWDEVREEWLSLLLSSQELKNKINDIISINQI